MFFGTSIAVCILILRKNKRDDKTLFINAANEFIKATNMNQLSQQNIENIISIYKNRGSIPNISALISSEKIKENDFNLSPSSYIESIDETPAINIKDLNKELISIVKAQDILRKEIDTIVRDLEA